MIYQHGAHSDDIMTHIGNLQSRPHCVGWPWSCYSGSHFLNGCVYLLFEEGGLGVLHFSFWLGRFRCFCSGDLPSGRMMVLHWCLNFFQTQQLRFKSSIIIFLIVVCCLWTLTGDSQYFKLGGGVMYHPSSGWICHTPGQDPSHLDDDVTQYMQHRLLWLMASYVVEETNNRDPKWDKVPLMENCYAHITGRKHWRSLSQTFSSYPPSSHTLFPHWIPWPAIWRAMLSSSTNSLVPQIDSFIIPHICLRHRHEAKLNLLCFLCIWVHSFSVCNPHFCKRDSHGVKGPSNISTWK